MEIICFGISLIATIIGSIVGVGGGIIIKPVLDAFGFFPVSAVSFMSGCTALAMAIVSLFKQRGNGANLQYRLSTPLAIGSLFGGLIGKELFEYFKKGVYNEAFLGGAQSVCLTLITFLVYIYMCKKSKLKSLKIDSMLICVLIGVFLGTFSSFLGIGGGTSIIAVLFLCFSMNAKEAGKNSLYIIIFSQGSNIIKSIVTDTIPSVNYNVLFIMIFAGVFGAILGSKIVSKITNKEIEKIFRIILIGVIIIDFYNTIKFFTLNN